MILKTKQRFKIKMNNGLTEEIFKTALSPSYDKRLQSIDSVET